MAVEEGRCSQSDLPPDMCAHCRNKHKGVERRRRAEYRTECGGCGGQISIGDSIGRVEGLWVCPSCTREATE